MSPLSTLAADLQVSIRLQPKQNKLHYLWDDSDYTQLGFGGARGGAKSGGGRRIMMLRRLKYAQTDGLILRRVFDELYGSHIIKLFEEFPWTRDWYVAQHKMLNFPNGSRLFFGYAEHERDMSRFYSKEYADIMADEAQEFSQSELEHLRASNRCTSNPRIIPKMVYTFMPGFSQSGLPPVGLPFLKRVFAEGKPAGEELKEKWAFIQAFSWDNVEWARRELGWLKDEEGNWKLGPDGVSEEEFYSWSDLDRRQFFISHTDYGRKLASLSNKSLRDAWLYGKWDVFEGQYFQQFSRDRHVMPADEMASLIQPWMKLWLSGDWGYGHAHAVYLHATDEHRRVYTLAESWGPKVTEKELAERINAMARGRKISSFVFSQDAGNLSKRGKPGFPRSIGQLIGDYLDKGIPHPHPTDASPGSRIAGARLMADMLDSDQWAISDACPRLIECLPTLVRDPDKPEDVLKVDYSEGQIGDDCYDAARYGLQFMLGASRKPTEQRIQERIEKELQSGDLTSAMFRVDQIRAEEKARSQPKYYSNSGSALRRRVARWQQTRTPN